MGEVEDDGRVRSFRMEDYSNRRAFLKSYPLRCNGVEEEAPLEIGGAAYQRGGAKTKLAAKVKSFGWRIRRGLLLLRMRFKNKLRSKLSIGVFFSFFSISSNQ